MPPTDLPTEAELDEAYRYHLGSEPLSIPRVAAGLVQLCYRNKGVVEGILHRSIRDKDMLRINSLLQSEVIDILNASLDADAFDRLLPAFAWVLKNFTNLGIKELSADLYEEILFEAEVSVEALRRMSADRNPDFVWRTLAILSLHSPSWLATPEWEGHVDGLLALPDVPSTSRLRELLMTRPWALDDVAAQWLVDHRYDCWPHNS